MESIWGFWIQDEPWKSSKNFWGDTILRTETAVIALIGKACCKPLGNRRKSHEVRVPAL